MNKIITGAIIIGAGVASYQWAQKKEIMSNRTIKRMRRKVKNALF